MNRQTPCYIVSTYTMDTTTDVNELTTANELATLTQRGIFNKLVEGTFEGSKEYSIVLHNRDEAFRILKEYNQDCILEIGADRSAVFHYQDGTTKYQGTWTSVHDGFEGDCTFDPSTGCKYTIRG